MGDYIFPHVLYNEPMKVLYNDARGLESFPVRFWTTLLNQDFTFAEGYIVAPEQHVHLDQRKGKQRVDVVVERWQPGIKKFLYAMIHEMKVETKTAKEVESQALKYAIAIIKERSLGELYILTSIGVTFRTWHMTSESLRLVPLFGGTKYLDVAEEEGDKEYYSFIQYIKAAGTLPKAPTLFSSANPVGTSTNVVGTSPTSSDIVMGSAGTPKDVGSNYQEAPILVRGNWTDDNLFVEFDWTDSKGKTRRSKAAAHKWALDPQTGLMTFYSENLNQGFACEKP